MNVISLKKKHSTYVKIDWKSKRRIIESMGLSDAKKLLTIISNYTVKRSVKEIAVIKYESLPAFITIRSEDYSDILEILNGIFLKAEDYEHCAIIRSILNNQPIQTETL